MKNRAFLIIFTTLISFNLGALMLNLKEHGINWDSNFTIHFHYEVSIYAIKVSIIGIIVDWITKDWFSKENKEQKKGR